MRKNTDKEVAERRNKVAILYTEGKKQSEIAKIVLVSEGQISLDLTHIRRAWLKASNISKEDRIAEELAKIDHLERKLWQAWEKSTKDHKRVISKNKGKTSADSPEYSEVTNMDIIKDGDPRYLQAIERCIDRRCKLLGLDAPMKAKVGFDDHSFLGFLMTTE
jgi:hypothetical protein